MSKKIPERMKALCITKYGQKPTVEEVPVPKLKNNHVLVKVEAAPINPSDQSFMNGTYGLKKSLPCIPGFEGSGTVVDFKGFLPWFLFKKGERIAFIADNKLSGSYAEYIMIPFNNCIPMPSDVPFETLATALINPVSIIAMIEETQRLKSTSLVQTGATSALGKMMIMYCKDLGIKSINIVRREDAKEELKKLGADVVLNINEEDFQGKLRKACKELKPKVCFDAVGGDTCGIVLNCLPENAKVLTFGTLAMQHIGKINPSEIIFRHKQLEGFHLNSFAKKTGVMKYYAIRRLIHEKLRNSFVSPVSVTMDMKGWEKGFEYYEKNAGKGKVILKPKF